VSRARKPLRVLLCALSPDAAYGGRLPLGYLKAFAEHSLGAAALRVDIVEKVLGRWAVEDFAAELLARRPDLIGFSCYFWNAGVIGKLAAELKRRRPRLRVVLGGPEVSADPKQWLRRIPADSVVYGEGEATFAELLGREIRKEPCGGVAGLAWRDKDNILLNPPRPPIEELGDIPSPYLRDDIRFEDTAFDGGVIETTRGCPFDCAFCAWLGGRGRVRYFPEDRVRREIRRLADQKPGLKLFVADADLFMKRSRAKRVLASFREEDPGETLQYHFETNFSFMDRELAELSQREGFLFRGALETTTPAAMEAANRRFSLDSFKRGVGLLKRHAPSATVGIELMLGMPGDTLKGFRRSLDWALDLRADEFYIYQLAILPGTAYFRDSKRLGLDWDPAPPHWVRSTKTFSAADLLSARKTLHRVAFLFNIWPVRAALESAVAPGTGGLVAACESLGAAVERSAGFSFRERFPGWDAPRKEGVFIPSGDWMEDEPPARERRRVLAGAERWTLKRLAGAGKKAHAARFFRAARERCGFRDVLDEPEVRAFLQQDGGEPLPKGGTLLIAWAKDWERHVALAEFDSLIALSEDKQDAGPVADSAPLKNALEVGCRPRTRLRPERWGKGYSRVLLSNTASYLPPQSETAWLRELRRRCPKGARLLLLDHMLGSFPLDIPDRGRPASVRTRLKRLSAELEAAGWKLRAAPRVFLEKDGARWWLLEARAR